MTQARSRSYEMTLSDLIAKVSWLVENAEWQNKRIAEIVKDLRAKNEILYLLLEQGNNCNNKSCYRQQNDEDVLF